MKVVKRVGVFETNSSSTHAMALVNKAEAEAEAEKNPKLKKFRTITAIKDKLLMACGCCHELYRHSEKGEALSYEYLKLHAENPDVLIVYHNIDYAAAIELLVGVYCEITGKEFEPLKAEILKKNKSGRACHMSFFEEGALYDASSDYRVIDNLFDGTAGDIMKNIREYFDDRNVLYYREYWNGMGMFEDD